MTVTALPKLLTEREAYEAYGHLLPPGTLESERGKSLGYWTIKGTIYYEQDELAAYVEQFVRKRAEIEDEEIECSIYFISVSGRDDAPIKIGRARNIGKRLAGLQTSHYEPLVILATIRGGRETENVLHRRFAKHRVRGEWFTRTEGLLATIDRLVAEQRELARASASLKRKVAALRKVAAG